VLLLGTLTAALWVLSGWWRSRWDGDLWVLRASRGQLFAFRGETNAVPDVRRRAGPRWSYGRLPDTPPRFNWTAAPERFPGEDGNPRFDARDWDARVVAYAVAAVPTSPVPGFMPERCWSIVLWPLPVPLWSIGGALWWFGWRARRRARFNRCTACGYDRRGLSTGSVCPECGKVPAVA